MKTLILTALVLLGSISALAGPRIVGNGGIAVEDGGKIYMLDLFERSVHKKPYYAPDVKPLADVEQSLEKTFSMSNLENIPMDRLVYKMSEVYKKSYLLGWYFDKAIAKLDWRMVDSTLVPSEDARTPIDNLRLKQVAIRLNNVVYISEPLWNKLDADNKVALILHEAAYFFVPPQHVSNGSERYSFQHAAKTRSITGLVFTKRFAIEGLTEENAEVNLLNVTHAPKLDADNMAAEFGLSVQMGKGTDSYPGYGDRVDLSKMENLEQLLSAYATKECTRLAAELSKEEKGKSTVSLKVILGFTLVTYRADLSDYDLKNGDTQKFMRVSQLTDRYRGFTHEGVIETKNAAASCLETTKYHIKDSLRNFTYKIK